MTNVIISHQKARALLACACDETHQTRPLRTLPGEGVLLHTGAMLYRLNDGRYLVGGYAHDDRDLRALGILTFPTLSNPT